MSCASANKTFLRSWARSKGKSVGHAGHGMWFLILKHQFRQSAADLLICCILGSFESAYVSVPFLVEERRISRWHKWLDHSFRLKHNDPCYMPPSRRTHSTALKDRADAVQDILPCTLSVWFALQTMILLFDCLKVIGMAVQQIRQHQLLATNRTRLMEFLHQRSTENFI